VEGTIFRPFTYIKKLKCGRAYFQTLHLHKETGMDFLLSFWWLSAHVHGSYKRQQKRKEELKEKEHYLCEAKMLNPYIKHGTFLVKFDDRIKIIQGD